MSETTDSETTFKCSECPSVYRNYYDLRKHVKKFHPLKLNEIAPLTKHRANLKTKTFNFVCDTCGKKFTYKKHLTFHHKKNHGISNDIQSKISNFLCDICGRKFTYKKHLTFHKKSHGISNNRKFPKKCPLCTFTGFSKTQLHDHFRQIHDIDLCFEILEFPTAQSFHTWKSSMENETKSLFVKECGDEYSNNHSKKILRYVCHRSGFYVTEGQQKRHLKIQGSKKIGGFCPAGCKVVVNSDGKYNVSYIKTHVGHTDELGHLTLTSAERREIAGKIAMKIPFSNILDEVRDRLCDNSVKRIHLLTNKDLNNIAASFNLQSEAVRHSNDAISIECWVNDIQQGQSVLFYKPQNCILEEHPELKSEDFILVIMNEGQAQILEKFGSDCICIDGTHGLNAYNFELHTLLVLDDLRQGFPTAFLISNRSDQEVMVLFFSCIKKRTGLTISPKVFMSDLAESYYNAWKQVMNEAQMRLFCTWHVDRAWRNNLHLINTKEKQVEIYQELRTLLQETDEIALIPMLQKFLQKSANNPDTSKFSVYFKNHYEKNVKSWAYCYRLHSGLNTNMHLERMHKTIKYIYLKGKHVKRLDKSVTCIMRFVKDKLFDRMISLNKGKISSKIKDLRKKHKTSTELNLNSITKIGNCWQILSSSVNSPEFFEIQPNIENCNCSLICTDCDMCIHKYSCSCLDSSIRWNMCKHIHLLGRKLKEQTEEQIQDQTVSLPPDSMLENQEENDVNSLHILVNPKNQETEDIYNCLLASSNSRHDGKQLHEKKEKMKRWFCSIVDSIQSDTEFDVLTKLTAPIEPTLNAAVIKRNFTLSEKIVPVPHNKKIDPQRRLFSTRKQIRKSGKWRKPSTQSRNQIAASLLNDNNQ